ncbi:MAG TPA: hypothetical protein VK154_09500 [Chitinophagales bacterium]|nr:hypothetical protein [Chitinophagales bacterium]
MPTYITKAFITAFPIVCGLIVLADYFVLTGNSKGGVIVMKELVHQAKGSGNYYLRFEEFNAYVSRSVYLEFNIGDSAVVEYSPLGKEVTNICKPVTLRCYSFASGQFWYMLAFALGFIGIAIAVWYVDNMPFQAYVFLGVANLASLIILIKLIATGGF